MGIEYELKFRAAPQSQAAIRSAVEGPETVIQMQTTYYDTPTGALSERWYTLRRRMENTAFVCTLKAPAKGYGRGEWEVACENIWEAIPRLCKLGAPEDLAALTAEGLIEVCGARFERIAKTVTLPEGVLELALDRGVLTGGGREIPLCEVEVELKSGEPKLAEMYALLLAERFGLEPESRSKFRRALALRKGE